LTQPCCKKIDQKSLLKKYSQPSFFVVRQLEVIFGGLWSPRNNFEGSDFQKKIWLCSYTPSTSEKKTFPYSFCGFDKKGLFVKISQPSFFAFKRLEVIFGGPWSPRNNFDGSDFQKKSRCCFYTPPQVPNKKISL